MQLAGERFELSGSASRIDFGWRNEFRSVEPRLPEDLREWVSEVQLAHLIEDAVESVSHSKESGERTQTWDMLLGILTYFYAIGLYISDEIEGALNGNANFASVQPLAFGNAPASAVLRRFRRANRGAIEQCLAEVFRAVYSGSAEANALGCCSKDTGGEVSMNFQNEAKLRLTRAIQADSWAMDV